jgi:hypothetical protein
MPAHAFGESQNFAGTSSCKICNNEHSLASLGYVEAAAVQNSPSDVQRPDVSQRPDDCSEVLALVAAERTRDVFPDGEVWLAVSLSEFPNNASCFMEQTTPLTSQPCPLARQAQIDARTPIGHHIHRL